jgi:hypothetical protein
MSAVAIVGAVRQEDTARQEELWDADTARRYDTPGTGMFAPDVLGPTARRLAELASGGPAAQLAGFELETRHADWAGAEFTADSRSHVSVYRLISP